MKSCRLFVFACGFVYSFEQALFKGTRDIQNVTLLLNNGAVKKK
jgi:hypothetical protein